MWSSEKIRALPAYAKAEFAWLLPLALANGVFECDPRRVWAEAYAYSRPEVTVEQVIEILHSFKVVGLLFTWVAEDQKLWGYWVGIEKDNRLPAPSRRKRKEFKCGPEPPQNQLVAFIRTYCVRNTSEGLGRLGLVWDKPSSTLNLLEAEVVDVQPLPAASTKKAFDSLLSSEPFGPVEFQDVWTFEYEHINGGGFTEAMEKTIQKCQSKRIKVPSMFFTLKRQVETLEIENKFKRTPM